MLAHVRGLLESFDGKQEVSPIILLNTPILADVLDDLGVTPLYPGISGVEFAHFESHSVAINHNSVPVELNMDMDDAHWMLNVNGKILLPHNAACWGQKWPTGTNTPKELAICQ